MEPPVDISAPPPSVSEPTPAPPPNAPDLPPPPLVPRPPAQAPKVAVLEVAPKAAAVHSQVGEPPLPKRIPVPTKPAPNLRPVLKPAPKAAEPGPTATPNQSRSNANAKARPASGAPDVARPSASGADSLAYQGAVLGAIAAHKRYPDAALGRAARGVAVVTFTIGGDGQVVSAQLSRSAGDAALDSDAVATVRRTSPFPPPPPGAPRKFAASLNYMPR
jgi:TonB family protein